MSDSGVACSHFVIVLLVVVLVITRQHSAVHRHTTRADPIPHMCSGTGIAASCCSTTSGCVCAVHRSVRHLHVAQRPQVQILHGTAQPARHWTEQPATATATTSSSSRLHLHRQPAPTTDTTTTATVTSTERVTGTGTGGLAGAGGHVGCGVCVRVCVC